MISDTLDLIMAGNDTISDVDTNGQGLWRMHVVDKILSLLHPAGIAGHAVFHLFSLIRQIFGC